MSNQPVAAAEALRLEERARRILEAALDDEEFMKDVRESQRLETQGNQGERWSDIKARLNLV